MVGVRTSTYLFWGVGYNSTPFIINGKRECFIFAFAQRRLNKAVV